MMESPQISFKIASRKSRIAAFFIDHFTFTFLMTAISLLAVGSDFTDEDSLGRMAIIMALVMIPGFLLFFGKESFRGISPGKWVMGIMVRGAEHPENIPSVGRLFVRNLFMMIWPVEFIVLAVNEDKRRLGDKVAKTIVVQNPVKAKRLPRILFVVGLGLIFFVFMFLFVGTAMKGSDAYKAAVHGMEQNDEIIKETGGIKGYGMMPTGGIRIANGSGEAQLQITVIGIEKDLEVSVYLAKKPGGDWKVEELSK